MVREISPPLARYIVAPSSATLTDDLSLSQSSKISSATTISHTGRTTSSAHQPSSYKRAILGERDDMENIPPRSIAASRRKGVKARMPVSSPSKSRTPTLVAQVTSGPASPSSRQTPRRAPLYSPSRSVSSSLCFDPRKSLSMSTMGLPADADMTQLLDMEMPSFDGLTSPMTSNAGDDTPKGMGKALLNTGRLMIPEDSQDTAQTELTSNTVRRTYRLPTPPSSQSNDVYPMLPQSSRTRPRPAPTPPRPSNQQLQSSQTPEPSPNPRKKKSPRTQEVVQSPSRPTTRSPQPAVLSGLSRLTAFATQPLPSTPSVSEAHGRAIPSTAPPANRRARRSTALTKRSTPATVSKAKERQSLPAITKRNRKSMTPAEIERLTGRPIGVLEKPVEAEPGDDPLLLKGVDDDAWLARRRLSRSQSLASSQLSLRDRRDSSAPLSQRSALAGPSRLREVISFNEVNNRSIVDLGYDSVSRSPTPANSRAPTRSSRTNSVMSQRESFAEENMPQLMQHAVVENNADSDHNNFDLDFDVAPGWESDDSTEIGEDEAQDKFVEGLSGKRNSVADDTFVHVIRREQTTNGSHSMMTPSRTPTLEDQVSTTPSNSPPNRISIPHDTNRSAYHVGVRESHAVPQPAKPWALGDEDYSLEDIIAAVDRHVTPEGDVTVEAEQANWDISDLGVTSTTPPGTPPARLMPLGARDSQPEESAVDDMEDCQLERGPAENIPIEQDCFAMSKSLESDAIQDVPAEESSTDQILLTISYDHVVIGRNDVDEGTVNHNIAGTGLEAGQITETRIDDVKLDQEIHEVSQPLSIDVRLEFATPSIGDEEHHFANQVLEPHSPLDYGDLSDLSEQSISLDPSDIVSESELEQSKPADTAIAATCEVEASTSTENLSIYSDDLQSIQDQIAEPGLDEDSSLGEQRKGWFQSDVVSEDQQEITQEAISADWDISLEDAAQVGAGPNEREPSMPRMEIPKDDVSVGSLPAPLATHNIPDSMDETGLGERAIMRSEILNDSSGTTPSSAFVSSADIGTEQSLEEESLEIDTEADRVFEKYITIPRSPPLSAPKPNNFNSSVQAVVEMKFMPTTPTSKRLPALLTPNRNLGSPYRMVISPLPMGLSPRKGFMSPRLLFPQTSSVEQEIGFTSDEDDLSIDSDMDDSGDQIAGSPNVNEVSPSHRQSPAEKTKSHDQSPEEKLEAQLNASISVEDNLEDHGNVQTKAEDRLVQQVAEDDKKNVQTAADGAEVYEEEASGRSDIRTCEGEEAIREEDPDRAAAREDQLDTRVVEDLQASDVNLESNNEGDESGQASDAPEDRPEEGSEEVSRPPTSRIVLKLVSRGKVKVERPSDPTSISTMAHDKAMETIDATTADTSSRSESTVDSAESNVTGTLLTLSSNPAVATSAPNGSANMSASNVDDKTGLLPAASDLVERVPITARQSSPGSLFFASGPSRTTALESMLMRRLSTSSSSSSRPSRLAHVTSIEEEDEEEEEHTVSRRPTRGRRSLGDELASAVAAETSFDEGNDSFRSVVEVSSLDPRAAARAAAILKLNHAYIEHGVLPSTTPLSSTIPLPTPSTPGTPFPRTPRSGRKQRQYESKHFASLDSARKLNRDELLYEAELEIVQSRRSRSRSRAKILGLDSTASGWESDETELALPGGWQKTPGQKRKRAKSIHRSSRTNVLDAAPVVSSERETREDGRPWGVAEWKKLEKVYRAEKEAWVKEREIKPLPGFFGWAKKALIGSNEVKEWDNERVVKRYLDEEDAHGLGGEWAEKMIGLRVKALEKRVNMPRPETSSSRKEADSHHGKRQKVETKRVEKRDTIPATPRREEDGDSTVVSIVPPSTIRRMLKYVWSRPNDSFVIEEGDSISSDVDRSVPRIMDDDEVLRDERGKKVENKLLTRLRDVKGPSTPSTPSGSTLNLAPTRPTDNFTPMRQVLTGGSLPQHPSSPAWRTPPIPGAFRSSFNQPTAIAGGTKEPITPKIYPNLNSLFSQRSGAIKALFETPSLNKGESSKSFSARDRRSSLSVSQLVKGFEEEGTLAKNYEKEKGRLEELRKSQRGA